MDAIARSRLDRPAVPSSAGAWDPRTPTHPHQHARTHTRTHAYARPHSHTHDRTQKHEDARTHTHTRTHTHGTRVCGFGGLCDFGAPTACGFRRTATPFPLKPFPLKPFPRRPFPLRSFPLRLFPLRPFPLRPFPLRPFPLGPFPLRPFLLGPSHLGLPAKPRTDCKRLKRRTATASANDNVFGSACSAKYRVSAPMEYPVSTG